jgi:phytoene dehydrogenase-like protein
VRAGRWSLDRLATHARSVGVEIRLSHHVAELPEAPVVVATPPRVAERLLEREIPFRGTSVAILDAGVAGLVKAPFATMDLDERTYVARYSAADDSLAPAGAELIQTSTPVRDGEPREQAARRAREALGRVVSDWEERCLWQRANVVVGGTGAVDRPDFPFESRPEIGQGDGIFLAGDYVQAPGMLSEVAWASGCKAGVLAAAFRQR